ncbi:MAG: type I DNA topoisomerase [Clostridium sp.]|jgi:DNA topoisomerase-1|nr:type I DNA topoisomerase [Clostridium sp.]
MAKYLVIVESPAKIKTIKKFLGTNYEVAASQGHVRDLPKSQLGIDVEHDYEPKYITIRGKGDLLAALRKSVKKAEKIYLATDPDREGEAISWHLTKALKLEDKKVYRITFNEITKNAVKESLKNAREIDMDLVDAQQARRLVDRMVGYRISPLLWAKIKRGLSAGRVQSVALRIICDREEEIDGFIPDEYWTLDVELQAGKAKNAPTITAKYYGNEDSKANIQTKEEMDALLERLKGAQYHVTEIKRAKRQKKSPLPFTTSTLQQEASKVLNFSTQKTMRLAQQLYEGIDIKGEGTIGLISYLRTDSTRVSQEAQEAAATYISTQYGSQYVAGEEVDKKTTKKVQDAHEAIRPTDLTRTAAVLKDQMPRDLFRLYQLIWKRFVASRMSAAIYETVTVKIKASEEIFTVSASQPSFLGFTLVYSQDDPGEAQTDSTQMTLITDYLELNSILKEVDQLPKQHFTMPPPHYNEASLVKALEELGIGRPSTYAPTITTIMARRYIAKENKNLYVTELGEVVNRMMKEAFPSVVDVSFTATMEALLDSVAVGDVKWKSVVANFYPDLDKAVQKAEKELEEIKIEDEVTDEICPQCGRNFVIKYGPHGSFLACPGFPDCRSTKPYFEKIGVHCPICGNEIVIKKTKKGRRYYGCSNYPDCDFMVWQKPSKTPCPQCQSMMLEKGDHLVCMNEDCKHSCMNTHE